LVVKKFNKFRLGFPYKYGNIGLSVNITGDNIGSSKNTHYSFDVYRDVEDSKYVAHAIALKEGYDGYGFGAGSHLMYEGVDSGIKASNQYFAVLTHGCFYTNYTYMCYNSNNLFGCIGIRKGDYFILNKKYSKEDYEALVPKIIKHMNEMPYIDKNGVTYKYGEFFPSEFSPFAYNETIAQEYFQKNKTLIIAQGYLYRPVLERNYKITLTSDKIPDHVKDVSDSIINEIIACPNNGNELTQCTEAYRIIKPELEFLRKNNIALPRYCPNCRHFSRLAKRNPLKLWHRVCQCAGQKSDPSNSSGQATIYTNTGLSHSPHKDEHCPNEFETSYSPDRPEIVYCEKCYQSEVV